MQIEEKYCDENLMKIESSSEEELPSNLQKSIDIIAKQEGYLTHKIFNRTISTEGGNYMATLYEVDIKGRTNRGKKETNLFVKYAISKEHMKVIDITDLYSKELFFYRDLNEVFTELQYEAKVPSDEMYKVIKCYDESDTEAIILKNLANEGFTTLYRMNVMPLEFAEMAVQQLAKFHSLSFVLEHKRSRYFDKKIKTLKQSIPSHENYRNFCRKLYNCSVKELDDEVRTRIDKKLPQLIESYLQHLNGNKTKVKCLCHGDYRMNNILMKVMEGEITEVIPVDYQLLYFGSPVVDFIFLIFGASDKEFRKNYLNPLKETYFETMENYLKYFEMDINSVYPRKEFERDYDECVVYGLQVTLFHLPFILTLEDNVPDLGEKDFTDITFNLNHIYYDRVRGVIDEMIELGKL